MKKTLLLLSFLFSVLGYAQRDLASAPTSEEEYNYVTKGYKVQVESGLDMKKGYDFDRLFEEKIGNYRFEISILIRTVQKEVAAIMVKTTSSVSGRTYYFCIPHGNPGLSSRYQSAMAEWDSSITKAYAYLMSSKFGEILPVALELEKKLKK